MWQMHPLEQLTHSLWQKVRLPFFSTRSQYGMWRIKPSLLQTQPHPPHVTVLFFHLQTGWATLQQSRGPEWRPLKAETEGKSWGNSTRKYPEPHRAQQRLIGKVRALHFDTAPSTTLHTNKYENDSCTNDSMTASSNAALGIHFQKTQRHGEDQSGQPDQMYKCDVHVDTVLPWIYLCKMCRWCIIKCIKIVNIVPELSFEYLHFNTYSVFVENLVLLDLTDK